MHDTLTLPTFGTCIMDEWRPRVMLSKVEPAIAHPIVDASGVINPLMGPARSQAHGFRKIAGLISVVHVYHK